MNDDDDTDRIETELQHEIRGGMMAATIVIILGGAVLIILCALALHGLIDVTGGLP